MRERLKNVFAKVVYRTGLLDILRGLLYKQRAVILMYHRVLPSLSAESNFVQPGMYVTIDTFRCHIDFLKERFEVVPLADLLARIRAGKTVTGCCVITFDDGWLDNYRHAFPVLQEYQVPASIFLASSFIGTNYFFWPERLAFYMGQPEMIKERKKKGGMLREFLSKLPVGTNKETFLDNAIVLLKDWEPGKRGGLFARLESICKESPPGRLLMNWDEVLEMQHSGLIDFGAHTANHVILDQVPHDIAKNEIVNSRKEIEARLSTPVVLFAYPNGNYNDVLKKMVKDSGFSGAVTTKSGWVHRDADTFALPRIGMHEDVSFSRARFYSRLVLQKF